MRLPPPAIHAGSCECCGEVFDTRIPPVDGGRHVPVLSDLQVCWDCLLPTAGPDLAWFPAAIDGIAACPYCGVELEPVPKRARACPACGERFFVRRVPHADPDVVDRRILTAEGRDEAADAWGEDEQSHWMGITMRLVYDDDVVLPDEVLHHAIALRGRAVTQYRRREAQWAAAAT